MELSVPQFDVVSNLFSFTIATMGAAALFFFLSRPYVGHKYRPALMVSGLVVAIACYHYYRIYESWHGAYRLNESGTAYVPTGAAFNDAYRYADWILTVPLLMVELIAVLALPRGEARSLLVKLVTASALMIGLGYPGEISSDTGTRWLWWGLSMVPFLYILYVLFTELTRSLERQPQAVRGLVSAARLVVLLTWSFYPIAYAILTVTGTKNPIGQVALQMGYTIADITAKAGFGLLIYFIAKLKSDTEAESEPLARPVSTGPAFA
ncbi:MAG: xanthorhodopsin [Isosphaeraceae bacterium]|jgi:bacteriorhodopsin|nr:MAG: xanthorhodopsin [Isosphaeraceae bacterium]